MERVILHIDVNNAFLSWTAVDMLSKGSKVDIRNTYAIIGASDNKRHGIVLAKSTPCKKMGVKTGEPYFMTSKKCPNYQIYKPDYKVYQKMSKSLFNLLSKYSPDIEVFSIDECFIDYGKVKKLHGDELEFAKKIQNEIYTKLGFTVNIGIGNNKLCAKMASDFSKPNQIHTLYSYEVKKKMFPLEIGELFGVGKKSAEKMRKIGINTIGDLAKAESNLIAPYFKNQTNKFIKLANGIDDGIVSPNMGSPKGIGISRTFNRDYDTKEEIESLLRVMCSEVASSLREKGKYASVISVGLRDKFFKNYSHQKKLKNATNITSEITSVALRLFNNMWDGNPIRLAGVSISELSSESNHQFSLFEDNSDRKSEEEIDKIIDSISKKYGSDTLKRASMINQKIRKKY